MSKHLSMFRALLGRGRLPRRAPRRLGLEVLEERVTPSAFLVSNTSNDPNTANSLPWAVAQANSNPGADSITFDSTVFGTPHTITLSTLTLTDTSGQTTISGPGANLLTVSGGDAFGVFQFNSGVTASLSGLTIANGNSLGGGINNSGTLTVTDCALSNNTSAVIGLLGGGIYNNGGTLTVTNSTLSGNSAEGGGGIFSTNGTLTMTNCTLSGNSARNGGGILSEGGTLTVTNCTLSDNSSTNGFGGGINSNGGTLTVTNSTLSGNSAFFGGGIFSSGTLTVTNSTLSGNSAASEGGGIFNDLGTLTVTNSTLSGNSAASEGGGIYLYNDSGLSLADTIVAGNSAGSSPDIFGPFTDQGHNLLGSALHSSAGGSGDVFTDTPLLAPLGNYGGPTQTMALLPGSPAIGAGSTTLIPSGVTTDQRGQPRTVGGSVDIGAFESQGFTISVVSGSGQSAPVNTAFNAPVVVSVTANDPGEPVAGGVITFTGPSSGASTSPAVTTATILANGANGQASDLVMANTVAGNYSVTAAGTAVSGSVSFALTNTAGAATSIVATSGSGQSATVNTAFASPLVATVTDQYGNPVPGASVTFAAPASGASATFPHGATVVTDSNGQASDSINANTVAGSYSVTATVSGVSGSASFTLTNTAGAAANIVATTGSGQSTTVNTAFASPLVVTVTDQYGNPVSGVSVTFAAPGSGASATFPNGATVVTGSNGQASDTATANGVGGSYPVSAAANGVSGTAAFNLTNTGTTLPAGTFDVLNPTASGAVNLSGNAQLSIPGVLTVDSSSSSAITASGNAGATATAINVVGGVQTSGHASLNPTPQTGAAAVADPFAGLAAPSFSGTGTAVNVSGNQSLTIGPGIYSQITVSGNGKLTVTTGTYVITTGGFLISGNASVAMSGTGGVLIYDAGGGIAVSGNATLNLSAETSGPYDGLVIFQARTDTRALNFSGNGVGGLSGTVYAAGAQVIISGNASLQRVSMVVNTLTLSGNAGAFQLSDGSSSDYLASTSNQILVGALTVAAEDDTGNGIDPNEVARLGDAMAYLNQTLGSFGVNFTWATSGTVADVTVHFASSTPEGGASSGVLGFTTAGNDVYLVSTGWDFYTGSDPSGIGSGQYDFQTLAEHELSHTVGLGESSDPGSVMYEYLSAGTVRRTFTDSNLSLINTDADRFMKAARALPQAQGETAGRFSSPTVFDNNLAALAAVLSEWKSAGASYGQQAANLLQAPASGMASNGSYGAGYYLNAGTGHDNGSAGQLGGGDALDWYFAGLADKAKQDTGEIVTTIA